MGTSHHHGLSYKGCIKHLPARGQTWVWILPHLAVNGAPEPSTFPSPGAHPSPAAFARAAAHGSQRDRTKPSHCPRPGTAGRDSQPGAAPLYNTFLRDSGGAIPPLVRHFTAEVVLSLQAAGSGFKAAAPKEDHRAQREEKAPHGPALHRCADPNLCASCLWEFNCSLLQQDLDLPRQHLAFFESQNNKNNSGTFQLL